MEENFIEQASSENIVIMTTNYSSSFMARVMEGAEKAAYGLLGHQSRLTVYCTYGDLKVKNQLFNDMLHGKLARAVIMIFASPDAVQAENFTRAGIPIIMVENKCKGLSSVSIDNKQASYEAVKHLISKGRKRIAIISGVTVGEVKDENNIMTEREEGYKQALKEAGIEFDPTLLVEKSRMYNFDEGYEYLGRIITHGIKPDALFCASGDLVAMGVMAKAKQIGLGIPDDIAIVGYDDIEAAQLVDPPLTTVRQPIEKLGEEALKLAYNSAIGKIKTPVDLVLPAELMIRKST